jgi:hypothetical protein
MWQLVRQLLDLLILDVHSHGGKILQSTVDVLTTHALR